MSRVGHTPIVYSALNNRYSVILKVRRLDLMALVAISRTLEIIRSASRRISQIAKTFLEIAQLYAMHDLIVYTWAYCLWLLSGYAETKENESPMLSKNRNNGLKVINPSTQFD